MTGSEVNEMTNTNPSVKRTTKFHRAPIGNIVGEAVLALFCALIMVPLLWMLSTSLRPPLTALQLPPKLIPTEFNLDCYRLVFQKVPFLQFGLNSLKIATFVTFGQLIICSLAAFAFARLEFPGKTLIFTLFLSAMMIPSQVTNIPQFIMMSRLRLVNTHWALMIPPLFSAMGVFLIRQNMLTIPKSFDEAAHLDGANLLQVYARIILPMAKPSLVVVAVLTFIGQWNDFYRALIFLNTQSLMTLPLGLTALRGVLGSGNQAAVIAGVMLALIAPMLFYIFGQRYLVEGAMVGGLKG